MSNVLNYDAVALTCEENDPYSSQEDDIQEYNELYEEAYSIYKKLSTGEFDEFMDSDFPIESMIEDIDEALHNLSSDYLKDEEYSRDTDLSNEQLKHYITHFQNIKEGLKEGHNDLLIARIKKMDEEDEQWLKELKSKRSF